MESVITQLTEHESKNFDKKDGSGQWTLHIFKDANGAQFQTIKQETANQAFPFTKEGAALARVVFTVEERGRYKNNEIQFIEAAPAGASQDDTSKFKYGGGGFRGGFKDQRAINRSAGIARAIEAHAAGLIQAESFEDLERFADKCVAYIERKTGSESQGDTGPSAGGGGADSGAAATAAAPSAGPSDSIPY